MIGGGGSTAKRAAAEVSGGWLAGAAGAAAVGAGAGCGRDSIGLGGGATGIAGRGTIGRIAPMPEAVETAAAVKAIAGAPMTSFGPRKSLTRVSTSWLIEMLLVSQKAFSRSYVVRHRLPHSLRRQRCEMVSHGALVMADYKSKYYGMPWILDTKYMYANGSMLKKAGVSPSSLTTWDGVITALKQIKAKGLVKYPWLGSWSQAEAVVCDYAQLLGAFGGKFLDASGKPAFQSGGGLKALEFMKMMLDQGLADPASTSSLEEDVLKAFAQGKIAMNLNWTFQLAASLDPKQSQVSKDNVMILRTPAGTAGGPAPGCNGGQPVMITHGTKHPKEAWEFVKFITSQNVQNQYVADSLPIWSASYDDPAVIKKAGKQLVSVAKTQLPNMILRPQVANYNAASQALQVQIQDALLGKKSPQDALNSAASAFSSQGPPA